MSLIYDTTDAIQTIRLLDKFGLSALICDADGVVQLLNNSAAALFGFEPGRLEGQNLKEKEGFEALAEMMALNQPRITPESCQVMDHLHCLVRMQRIGRIGYLFTFEDITSLKELEEQQNAALHMVAHDLQNPISAIKSYADLVSGAGELNDKQSQFLARIYQSVRTMHGLVRDLLDIAWIDSGKNLNPETVNINQLIHTAIQALENRAIKRDITIQFNTSEDLPAIKGDSQRLERVFVNVLSNAIKYSTVGDEVEIAVSSQDNHVIIAVADNGMGIPAEHIPHIFKRFYRVPSEDDKTEGTGLGLSIVSAIVERHQGQIEVISEVGVGSTFTITLPIEFVSEPNPEA